MGKSSFVLIAGIVFVVGAASFFVLNKNRPKDVQTSKTQSTNKEAVVPLPQEEDIVRSFFEIIGEHRPSDAISMMSQKMIGDDNAKQAWGVQFNAFETVQVKTIEPSMQAGWTENSHSYKVVLTVQMKPEAANAPIPYYGWGDNPNTRFIKLIKSNEGIWKVDEIATGP